jgi:hypothetical protein
MIISHLGIGRTTNVMLLHTGILLIRFCRRLSIWLVTNTPIILRCRSLGKYKPYASSMFIIV